MPWKYLSVCYWFLNLAHSFFGYIKNNQPLDFFGRNDAKAESPVLWPPHAKSWLILKDPDVGKDWGQEEKGPTEDEMVGLHHRHNGHGFGWTPEVGDGQGGLVCCSSWGHKEWTQLSDWTGLNCNSSSPAFLMICSMYRLNKQGHSRQPCHTSFSIFINQSFYTGF